MTEKKGTDLRDRTKSFAVRIVRLYGALPKSTTSQVIGKQLLRSGTSVGAHYREGYRARAPAEFVSKIEVALQELDETDYWIELLVDCEVVKRELLASLREEINELLAILTASVKTVKQKRKPRTTKRR